MNSNYKAYIDRLTVFDDNWVSLVNDIDNGNAATFVYCYIHAQISYAKQIKQFHLKGTTNEYLHFRTFLKEYAKYHEWTFKNATSVLLEASTKTVAELSSGVLRDLLKEYDLNEHLIADVLGYDSAGLNKYFSGELVPYKEMILGICMFLELDIERVKRILFECGYSLTTAFPDCVFKKHIEDRCFSVNSWVDDVNKMTQEMNRSRVESSLETGGKRPALVKLHSFYRSERPYPVNSVSVFKAGDKYVYNRKEFPHKLFPDHA